MALANFNQIQLPVSGSYLDPTGNPPRFYGYIHESFTEFLSKFKLYALRLNLDSDQKMQILPSYLMGPAASIYAALPDYEKTPTAAATATGTPGTDTYVPAHGDTNFNTLAEALAQYFNNTEHKTYFQRLVMQRKQFPDESFSDFAIDIIRMFDIAYADMKANDDTALIRQQQLLSIIRTNADHEICAFLLEKDPHSVQEAVTMVARYQLYKPDRETLKADKTKLLNRLDKLIDAIHLEDNESDASPPTKFSQHTNAMYAPQSLKQSEQYYNQEEEKVINDHLMIFGRELEEQKQQLIDQQKQLASLDGILRSQKKKVTWKDQQEPPETDELLPEDPQDYTDRGTLSYWRDMSVDRETSEEDPYYHHENRKNRKRQRREADDYDYNQSYQDNDQLSQNGYENNEYQPPYANGFSPIHAFNQQQCFHLPPSTFAIYTGRTNTNFPSTIAQGHYKPEASNPMTNVGLAITQPSSHLQPYSDQLAVKPAAHTKASQVTEQNASLANKYSMWPEFWPAKRLAHAYSFSSLNSEEEDEISTIRSSTPPVKLRCNMIELNYCQRPQTKMQGTRAINSEDKLNKTVLQDELEMPLGDKLGKTTLTYTYPKPLQISIVNDQSPLSCERANWTEKLMQDGVNELLQSQYQAAQFKQNNISQTSFNGQQLNQILGQIKKINEHAHHSRKMVPYAWDCLESAEKVLGKQYSSTTTNVDLVIALQYLMITLSCRPQIHPSNVKKLRRLQQKLTSISTWSQPLTYEAETGLKTEYSTPSKLNCVPSANSSSLLAVSLPLRHKNIYVVHNKARARGFNGYLQKAYERQEDYSIAQQKIENVQKNKDKKMIPAEKELATQKIVAANDVEKAHHNGPKVSAQLAQENEKKFTKKCFNIRNHSIAHVGQKTGQGGPHGQWFSPISSYKNSDLFALVSDKQECSSTNEKLKEKHFNKPLPSGQADEPIPDGSVKISLSQMGDAQFLVDRKELSIPTNGHNLTSTAQTTPKTRSSLTGQTPALIILQRVQKEKEKDTNYQLMQMTKTSLDEGQYKTRKLPTTFKRKSNTSVLKAGQ